MHRAINALIKIIYTVPFILLFFSLFEHCLKPKNNGYWKTTQKIKQEYLLGDYKEHVHYCLVNNATMYSLFYSKVWSLTWFIEEGSILRGGRLELVMNIYLPFFYSCCSYITLSHSSII